MVLASGYHNTALEFLGQACVVRHHVEWVGLWCCRAFRAKGRWESIFLAYGPSLLLPNSCISRLPSPPSPTQPDPLSSETKAVLEEFGGFELELRGM